MTIIINLFGGPGSGKSTIAAGLFYTIKKSHISCELVTEYAKDLVYRDVMPQYIARQEYIFAKQNMRLASVVGKVDYVVTDSPLLLSSIYGLRNHATPEELTKLIVATHNQYICVNIFLNRPNQFQTYGRYHDFDESVSLDLEIKEMLATFEVPYHIVDVNQETVENIIETVGVII